jgi:hypothetical protein
MGIHLADSIEQRPAVPERSPNGSRTKSERRRTGKHANPGAPGAKLWVTPQAWGRID